MYTADQPTSKAARLDAEHFKTIEETLPLVGKNIEMIADVFYSKMFAAHPELLSNLFNRSNQKQGAQQKALAASVATFAKHLVDPLAPDPVKMLNRVAHKHASLGITADQYQLVHDNLMAAIADVLASAVTPEVGEAWSQVYWLMADVLVEQETKLYASDNVAPGAVFRTATVTEKTPLCGNVMAYTLVGDFSTPRPGQYTSVGVSLPDGARQLRQYSIIAGDAGCYRIAVLADGEVSTFLSDNIEVGDTVDATIAAGDLVLRERDNPVVLISSGIGSTPMVSILRYLTVEQPGRKVTYIHADAREDSWAQREDTRALIEAVSDATLSVRFRDLGEKIDIAEYDLAGSDVYLCGGVGFLQEMRADIEALPAEAAPDGVYFEQFSPNDWLIS